MKPTVKLTRMLSAVCLLALCLAAAGCGGGSKINQANYDKINNGMSRAEVEGILGPGKEQAIPGMGDIKMPGGVDMGGLKMPTMPLKVLMWQDGDKLVSVTLMNDKVQMKNKKGF